MTVNIASVDSIILTLDDSITLEASLKVKFYYEALKDFDAIVDLVPSYTTLLITYDIFKISYDELKTEIEAIVYEPKQRAKSQKLIEVPVYYGKEVGIDLERISHAKKISIEEIIDLHTSTVYNVFAIGFSPGFAYLAHVNEKIAMPRLQTPRKFIEKGSVAIADSQTAIYPQQSPGGWNIVGMTRFNMFDKNLETLCPVSMGDQIKFKSISKEEFMCSKDEWL